MKANASFFSAIDANLISLNCKITSAKKLLEEMAQLLSESATDCEPKRIYQQLLEREKLGNTGIGNGVALPHSRNKKIDNAIIAIITLDEAVDYDSLDKQKVSIAFGLLVPEQANQEHLEILSTIAQAMSEEKNRQQLLTANSSEQVIELLKQW